MTTEVIQLISSLGFPIALVVIFLVFFDKRIWPWFIDFMKGYVETVQKNTVAFEKTTATLVTLEEQIHQQPNTELAGAVAKLIERMDLQHLNLSQQMASIASTLGQKLDMNRERIDENTRRLDLIDPPIHERK